MEMNNDINRYLSSDFQPLTLSSVRRPETSPSALQTTHQNSRKKRTKFIRIDNFLSGEQISKPKPIKKPDPAAPKITRPCTECGKKFWSWKALFGHMRCHPERQWRGINPPPNFRRTEIASSQTEEDSSSVTEEDHEVATCLLMLANGPAAAASDQSPSVTTACTVNQATPEYSDSGRDPDQNMVDGAVGPTPAGLNCGRFECSSCKKVFGSHQALGGHRASHKNVKGCYAITKNDGEEEGCCSEEMAMTATMTMMMKDNNTSSSSNINGHKCSICFRVFSSGQALGGHMRCHWEKVEEPSPVCGFDLNMAAPLQDYDDASSPPYSSGGLALDLRLGL